MPVSVSVNASRHWLLLHAGARHLLSWDDGERLLALNSAVRTGKLNPQRFSFTPRGSTGTGETIFVDANSSFELLTQYDAEESHWFG